MVESSDDSTRVPSTAPQRNARVRKSSDVDRDRPRTREPSYTYCATSPDLLRRFRPIPRSPEQPRIISRRVMTACSARPLAGIVPCERSIRVRSRRFGYCPPGRDCVGRRRGLFGTIIHVAVEVERAERPQQRALLTRARAHQRASAAAEREAERAEAEYDTECSPIGSRCSRPSTARVEPGWTRRRLRDHLSLGHASPTRLAVRPRARLWRATGRASSPVCSG